MERLWNLFGIWCLEFGFLIFVIPLAAQVPDAAPSASSGGGNAPASSPALSSAPASSAVSGGNQGGTSPFGKDLPFFNPGNEVATWNGVNWNITQNRLFQSQFERYLNAPEETTKENKQYQDILRSILEKLSPQNGDVDGAFRLLTKASNFKADAHLCDTLADAVYSFWGAKHERSRLEQADSDLEEERKTLEWNAQMESEKYHLSTPLPSKDSKSSSSAGSDNSLGQGMGMQPYIQRLAEVNAKILANKTKKEVNQLQTKVEFQTLIVNFFLQRRFQHVLMATRFYRHLTEDGDTSMKLGKETQDFFSKNTGMPPTVASLDSAANEAIRTVSEGVEAFKFLLGKNELESATKRLQEAFLIGEYMPEIRELPRDQKRQALEFTQKSNQLLSTLDVKDYSLAEKLVKEINDLARDCDTSKATAAIETARTVSKMHLAKATNAAVRGDRETLEAEFKEAAAIWPRNPDLDKVATKIYSEADVQQQALSDFDQLLSQHNYRQIYDDKMRFIAATALDPAHQEKLKKVLDDMQAVESAMIRCNEIAKNGNSAGAWENAERVTKDYPDDNKLNQLLAKLSTDASEFVHTLRTAQELESKDQMGSSLAWYLKAQKIYPPSEFAQEGIQRLLKKILPSS